MDFPEFDALLASITEIENLTARQQEAFEYASGTYIDNPIEPTVAANVWQGKVAALEIADAVCKLPAAEAAAHINHVVINAFMSWREDFLERAGLIGERQ